MSEAISVHRATGARLLRRSCDALLGICSGLLADGVLNDAEIVFLRTWLAENEELCNTWPGELVFCRVAEVLADGVVTEDEREHLLTTLLALVGGNFSEDGAIPAGATSLPVEPDAMVGIAGRSFCFTGQFIFGTRAACERAVMQRGGEVSSVKQSLDYLVIGDMASRDWRHQSFGAKIEEAMNLKAMGHAVSIVSEGQWVRALGSGHTTNEQSIQGSE